ncbi:MAG: TrkH family potassium uptake protein [Actinobacteria bacterium]|nr:TrkH family potassium uptake protein [Actinomycetota bacterium]
MSSLVARRRTPAARTFEARDRRPVSAVANVVGFALVFTAAGLAVCSAVELLTDDEAVVALAVPALLSVVLGTGLWKGTRVPDRVSAASAFAAVGWTWIAISAVGALPFWWSGMLPALDDALFESVSGFTGTGATVLTPIEGNGAGLLLWRQATQWYGGMGVIVLAVAVLPLLGVGGFELLRAESPGPTSDRLAPRVRDTARRLWMVYLGLTVLIVVALFLTGLSPYDAVAHAMTTVSTGGFSNYDASIAAFDSAVVEGVLIVSMFAGAVSFALWWQVLRGAGPRALARSSELRTFVTVIAVAIAFVTVVLALDTGLGVVSALRGAAFTVVATMSTTGYATVDFALWPAAGQLVVLGLMVSGGMAGSTSGAMKLFRVQVMVAHARREMRHLLHPSAVLPVKLSGHVVADPIVSRIVGFFVLYVVLAMLGTVLLAALGADLVTAASAITSAIGAYGPALGDVGPTTTYLNLDRPSRAVLVVYMLLGRLELFTLLLMFVAPVDSLRYHLHVRRRRLSR